MKILVCGGRRFNGGALLDRVLDDLHFGTGPDGGPRGTQPQPLWVRVMPEVVR